MSKLQDIIGYIREYKYSKYLVTIFFIVLIVGFIDDNSFWNRRERKSEIRRLQNEIESLKHQFEEDSKNLKKLEEYDNVVRLAREKYLMKRPNEDVYIINYE